MLIWVLLLGSFVLDLRDPKTGAIPGRQQLLGPKGRHAEARTICERQVLQYRGRVVKIYMLTRIRSKTSLIFQELFQKHSS